MSDYQSHTSASGDTTEFTVTEDPTRFPTPTYPSINSVFKRDEANNYKTFLMGEWADPAFGVLANIEWVGTEKVDGTNCRIHITEFGYTVGGKSAKAQLHPDLVLALEEVGDRTPSLDLAGLTLYGEGYGPGIQGGGHYRADKGFILFDVMVTVTGIWLERENVVDIGNKLDIPVAPVTYIGSLNQAVWHFENHRPMTRNSIVANNDRCEGWVLRPARELRTRLGHRVITKIKVRDFPR